MNLVVQYIGNGEFAEKYGMLARKDYRRAWSEHRKKY